MRAVDLQTDRGPGWFVFLEDRLRILFLGLGPQQTPEERGYLRREDVALLRARARHADPLDKALLRLADVARLLGLLEGRRGVVGFPADGVVPIDTRFEIREESSVRVDRGLLRAIRKRRRSC